MTRSIVFAGMLGSACVTGPYVDPLASGAEASGESTATIDPTTTGSASTGSTEPPPAPECDPSATQHCYSGPVGTEGVGPCKAGTQTCDAAGFWGACEGEVLPSPENACGQRPSCAAPCGQHLWSRRFPATMSTWVTGAAIDPSGNIVLHGTFGGAVEIGGIPATIELGDITLTATTDYTPWIAKFAPDGTPMWGRILGEDIPDMYGQSLIGTHDGNIVITDDGGVIMTGRCVDAIDFGDGPILGTELDPFVVRLSAAGDVEWGHRFAGLGEAAYDPPGMFAAAGADGDTWVAGTLFGSIDLGGETLVSTGYGDVLLIRFDAAGQPEWHRQLGNPGMQVVGGIAVDGDGAPIVVGHLEGSLTVENVELISAGLGDVFVIKWTAAGTLAWARRFGENRDQSAGSVAVVGDRMFISGTFEKEIDLGGGPLNAGFDEWGWVAQPFLAAFDAEGTHQWSRRAVADDTGYLAGPLIGGVSSDFIVGTGYISADLDFGGTRFGDADGGFVAVFDAEDGGPRWLRGFANHVQWTGIQVVSTLRDQRLVTAFVDGELHDLGGGPLGEPGALSLYLAAYQP